MELDDRLTVPSAEGIDLDLVLAGVGSRALAQILDLLVVFLTLFVLTVAVGSLGAGGVAVFSIGSFVLVLGYPILFETFNSGRSLGKMALGIQVVALDGGRETFIAAVIRNVVRFIDILPGVYTVGFVSCLATKRSQRVGDLAASTLVIRRSRPKAAVPAVAWAGPAPSFGAPSAALDTAHWDLSAVTPDEVAAVREFLGRRFQLQPAARANLADTLCRQIYPKVAGVPFDGGPESFLERIAQAKYDR